MADTPLQDLVARLERERREADTRYHEAFAALDAAVRALPQGAPRVDDLGLSSKAGADERLWDVIEKARRAGGLLSRPSPAQQEVNAALAAELQRARASQETLARGLAVMAETIAADRAASARLHTDLILFLQTITAYVDSKDRALGGPELREQVVLANERALALKREFDRLQPAGSGLQAGPATDDGQPATGNRQPATDNRQPATGNRQPATDFSYAGFEDRFRGSEDEIRARVAGYVPLFADASPRPDAAHPVLDVGCGRGELLGLLAEAGLPARGIDLNAQMVARCRARGFTADQADALSFLDGQPDASLGGLTAIQVVEHLEPGYLARFLETAFHKLRPGAPIVLETINPGCWMAFFETYLRDLTHAQPIHADVLRFLVQAAGFSSVDVEYRGPVSEADRLKTASRPDGAAPPALLEAIDVLNAHADALNARLFGFMDYVVIARR